MNEIEVFRQTAGIDPHLHIWGWEVPVYLFLGGVTAGLMILNALLGKGVANERMSNAMRRLPFAAPVLLSIGMFALLLDLEYKAHVYRFYTSFQASLDLNALFRHFDDLFTVSHLRYSNLFCSLRPYLCCIAINRLST